MQSRVFETVERPSVCLPVCLFHQSTAAAACGGFAAEDIDRPGAQQQRRRSTRSAANAGSAMLTVDTIRYDTIRDAILTCARKPT